MKFLKCFSILFIFSFFLNIQIVKSQHVDLEDLAQNPGMFQLNYEFFISKGGEFSSYVKQKPAVGLLNFSIKSRFGFTFGKHDEYAIIANTGIVHTNYGLISVGSDKVKHKVLALGIPLGLNFHRKNFYYSFGGQYMWNYHYKKTTIILDEKLKDHGFIRDEVNMFTPMIYFGVGNYFDLGNSYFPISLKLYYLPATFLNKKFTDNNSINLRPFENEPDKVFILSLCFGI